MKSRTSGYSSDTEQTKQQDLSVLRKPILTSLTGFLEAKRAFENGTEEIRRLLSRECDIMYECKVCRNVFRSLTNFISHKRVYCREQYNHLNYFDSHKNGFIDQDVSTIIQAEQDYIKNSSNTINSLKDVNTTNTNSSSNKTSNNNLTEKTSKDLSSIIERLIKREQVNRVLKLTDFYDQINNKLTQEEILRKNHILQLDRVPNSKIAVYQTVKHNDSDNIKNEVNEIHDLLLNNKTVLGPDGKILINKNEDIYSKIDVDNNDNSNDDNCSEISKPKIQIDLTEINSENNIERQLTTEECQQSNVVCDICNQKFQTEKTLKLHLQTKHIQSTYVYQCPSCTQTFLQPSAVIRHLSNDHKKSMRRIRLMRETIYKRRIRLDEIQVKGPNRELARLQTYNKQRDAEDTKIWFDNNERSQTNSPFCTYCGKKFERKAVLTTHLNSCSAKNRQTPPTLAASSKKTATTTTSELTQNSISLSSVSPPLPNTIPATVISSSSPTISSTTTPTSSLQNSTSNSSAFVKIAPNYKIEQSKLNTNNDNTTDSLEIVENTIDTSKSFKHHAVLVDKKLSNTLKLLREEQQKQQHHSINSLIVNKRKRRKTKKNINPIIKTTLDNTVEGNNLNDTKSSANGSLLEQKKINTNSTEKNIKGQSNDKSTEKIPTLKSTNNIKKELIKKDSNNISSSSSNSNNNKSSLHSVSTIKKDKNKLLKLFVKNSEKELTYFCRICKKSFCALSNLRRHISMFHYRRRKFGCKICDYRAFRKYDVSNHLNSVHSIVGEKTFELILVAEDKGIKEDVDDDVIVMENGIYNNNGMDINKTDIDIKNDNNSTNRPDSITTTSTTTATTTTTTTSNSTSTTNKITPGTENVTKKTYVQKRGRKPKLQKNSSENNNNINSSNINNNTSVLVINDKDNLNFSKFTRSSSNLSLSSNEDISATVAPKRPIRNRIKPVNKDFVYDLSNLLKKDMLYAERESILTAKAAAAQRRRNTVITIDDSSRESGASSTSTSISNSPPNSEFEIGKVLIRDKIKGSAQVMAQLAVSSFSACFNTPPELPTERPLIPSKLLAQIRQHDRINNTILNKTIPDIENYQGFKGFDDMKKIKQLRRVSDDSIIRSLTKKRKIDLDYASLSDSPSSRLLRKVDLNVKSDEQDICLDFNNQYKNNATATVISQQNGASNSDHNNIEENINNNNDIDTKITEKLLVKCPTEKEFQEYLIANKLTDPVKKINITETIEAEAILTADDTLNNPTEIMDSQTVGNNKRITLFQRLAENQNKKLKESLLRSALEN